MLEPSPVHAAFLAAGRPGDRAAVSRPASGTRDKGSSGRRRRATVAHGGPPKLAYWPRRQSAWYIAAAFG
jgi:hypothetical protein